MSWTYIKKKKISSQSLPLHPFKNRCFLPSFLYSMDPRLELYGSLWPFWQNKVNGKAKTQILPFSEKKLERRRGRKVGRGGRGKMTELLWFTDDFHRVMLLELFSYLKILILLQFVTYKYRLKKNWSIRILSQPSRSQARISCFSPAGNYLLCCSRLSFPSNCYPSVSIKPLSHLSHLNISFLFLNTSNQILTSNIYIAFPQISASEDSVICYFIKNVIQHLSHCEC